MDRFPSFRRTADSLRMKANGTRRRCQPATRAVTSVHSASWHNAVGLEDEKHGEAHGMISDEIGQDVLKRIFFITERVIVFDGLDDVFEHIVKTSVMLTKAEAATIRVFDINTGKLAIVKESLQKSSNTPVAR